MEQDQADPRGLTIDQLRVGISQTIGSDPCTCYRIQRKTHTRTEAHINPTTNQNFSLVLEILPGFDWSGATGVQISLRCWTGIACEWIFEASKDDFVYMPKEHTHVLNIDKFLLRTRDNLVKKFKLRFARLKTKDTKLKSHAEMMEMVSNNALLGQVRRIMYGDRTTAKKVDVPDHSSFSSFEVPSGLVDFHGITHRVR